MDETSRRLRDALVAAYPGYVAALLRERGWPEIPESVAAGAAWLAESLDDLLVQPFAAQGRGPLEVFQEAMRHPNEALARAGAPVPERDPAAASALPGDLYDLAPASSRALGEEVWLAHLAWGTAKAAALSRLRLGVLSANLLDVDRIERAVSGRGYRVERIRGIEGASTPAVLFVDLEHPAADDVIRTGSLAGSLVVGYGPHVDDLAMVRARSLGAAAALPRSRFFADPAALLPPLL